MSSSSVFRGAVYVIGDRESIQLFKGIGLQTVEAHTQEQVLEHITKIEVAGDAALIIVLRDVITNEEAFRKKIAKLATPIYLLPTLKSPGKPLDPGKLLAQILGVK
ncbi:MAG: V-type ATP synthase subunit F [Acidilobaceae archaeon]